jgi:hypothetical protein
MALASLIVSIFTGLAGTAAAVFAWQAARASAQSAGASEKSASAAATAAELELDRRHSELKPRLRVAIRQANPGSADLELSITLLGPPELRELSGLAVTIRNNLPASPPVRSLPNGPTPEQVADQIWGPYRFVPHTGPGADPTHGLPGADSTGRRTTASELPVGEEHIFALEPTAPPPWTSWDPHSWLIDGCGFDIKFKVECHHASWRAWTLTGELGTAADNAVEL